MVSDAKLADLLSEFARQVATDFSIQAILKHLVTEIVEVLPISAAGVLVMTRDRAASYAAGSDDDAMRLEELQIECAEGPCLAAYNTGQPVAISDLATDATFPTLGPRALATGIRAVFAFPLCREDRALGALGLYRDSPGPLDARDTAVAQTLADVAVAYLLNAEARQEDRQTAERYRHLSLHDPLTGLPNRALLGQRLEHAVLRTQRSRAPLAVLFADLDRFKQVNDSYGHQVGDEVLVAVAARLQALIRPGDTLARVSGDEFVILCEDLRDAREVEMLAARITNGFGDPFRLSGLTLLVSASVGIAFAGRGEDLPAELMRDADQAMYQAKRQGGGRHQIIEPRDRTESDEREILAQDLRRALAAGRLGLAYHPIVRTQDGGLTGVEALLRWDRPDDGPVPPATVIPLAERIGMIGDLGRFVLRRACEEHARWPVAVAGGPLGLSVNVSAQQLTERGFSAFVAGMLRACRLPPSALTLEMTESVFLADVERALLVLSELRDLGVRLALDDFGTGHVALGYLKHLRVDVIKIDRGFIADVERHRASAAVVSAVVDMAHDLGVAVVAEGVESLGQRDAVASLGCDNAQGFYFARPMARDELATMLSAHPTGRVHLPVG